MADASALRVELEALIGADSLLAADADASAFLVDHRHLYRGHALAIALPRSLDQVTQLVRWCASRRVGLVPQGGNTGYCGGATPDESGSQLLLSMQRMNAVREVDAANFSLTAEAGCVLARVRQAAQAADCFFPLSLGSEGSCQIGGTLSTNAGGLNVVRYGMTRDLVLGIEAVLPNGEVLRGLKSLRKDNTGYDLKSLLIGAEGTLGVITAASLKLWPKMRTSATAFIAVRDPSAALTLLNRMRHAAAEELSSFELIPRIAVELTVRHIDGVSDPLDAPSPWYVLCEWTSSGEDSLSERLQQALGEAADAGELEDAAFATSERVRQQFWQLREHIPEAQRRAGASLKHDISVPVASLPAFMAEASQWVYQHVPEGVLVAYGHAGDGNLHFNIGSVSAGESASLLAREAEIRRSIHDRVARFHGSISAEHGIGRLKRAELQRYADPTALACMRAIKHALDPLDIMNPGKLL